MEMESSRRPSFDRSRELGLKRARLAEEPAISNRSFQQKQLRLANSGAAVAAASPRFRLNNDKDRDSDEPLRATYQQPNQLQQHQELVNQYKAALAELTFNSKPIITNLTIIAGENTHAAKSIAAAICSNIIEVPSEQKLPSLYLLDSIVKNIGRDYIKHFAAKLPEVFCKAYRQVEPPVHSSMQHLFGTWKGVFPLQCLQIIERDLGFAAVANGSSSNTPRADAQRQPHSIHVNPKYLEARRIQQSGRNVQSQREELQESGHEKPVSAEFEDHEYVTGQSRIITSRLGKLPNERITDHSYDKQWSSAGRGVEESISNQRNGVNARQSSSASLMPSRSASMLLRPTHNVAGRSGREFPTSWKNSEEEEYMWDDLNPAVSENVAVDNSSIHKDHWHVDGIDKLEYGGRNSNRLNQADLSRIDRDIDSLSTEHVPFGRQQSLPRTAFQSQSGTSNFGLSTIAAAASGGSLGQRHKPLVPSRDPRLNLVDKEQPQTNLLLVHPNRKPPLLSRASENNIKISEQPQTVQKTTPVVVSSIRSKLPSGQADSTRAKQLGSSAGDSSSSTGGQMNASALLAAVIKTGISLPNPKSVSSSDSPPRILSSLSKTKPDESSTSNPYSSLINTLMAKGLITDSNTEPDTPSSPPPVSTKPKKQIPTTASKTQVPKPSQAEPQAIKTKTENLIGYEFKLDLIRQFHPSVVDALFQDLQHSCTICGLRLKLKESLERHLEWHESKELESRKWYANSADWVAGKAVSDNMVILKDPDEPMVPADESHCVCLLCGELFEDYYSLERDEWMFKGAVYMTVSSTQNNGQGVIVHAKCMADDSVGDLVQQPNFSRMERDV